MSKAFENGTYNNRSKSINNQREWSNDFSFNYKKVNFFLNYFQSKEKNLITYVFFSFYIRLIMIGGYSRKFYDIYL